MRILTLTNEQVLSLAEMRDAVDELQAAFVQLAAGLVESPVRTRFKMTELRNILLMPSLIRGEKDTLSLKVVSVYPDLGGNAPSTKAAVLLVDGRDGELKCMMGGTSLTGLRTGAVSGLSCRYLARRDSRRLAMIGAGGQGFYQISGVSSQLGLSEVAVFDIDSGRQKRLMERCEKELHLKATAADTVASAARGADVIVTATTSKKPVLDAAMVAPGTHVVAIGAYTPDARELASDLVAGASVYVDSMDAAMEEAGDIVIPMREGRLGRDGVRGEMADLVTGKLKGRTNEAEITIFKAVGLAFEDNAVGWAVYDRAVREGVGGWTEL